jgi:hypothetical protein
MLQDAAVPARIKICRRKIRLDMPRNYKKSPAGSTPPDYVQLNCAIGSVGQHSLISAAAVLINDSLAGLVIDFVALAAGLGYIFRRGFVTIS